MEHIRHYDAVVTYLDVLKLDKPHFDFVSDGSDVTEIIGPLQSTIIIN